MSAEGEDAATAATEEAQEEAPPAGKKVLLFLRSKSR